MRFDRTHRYVEFTGNDLVAVTLDKKTQDIVLAIGQRLTGNAVCQSPSGERANVPQATAECPDRIDQFDERAPLDEIAACALLHGVTNLPFAVARRHDENTRDCLATRRLHASSRDEFNALLIVRHHNVRTTVVQEIP